MRTLLDTWVLSELRRPRSNAAVRRAVDAFDSSDLYVSVVSVGEITKGIALLQQSRKRRELETWLHALERAYGDQILPIDVETSRIWGELTAAAQQMGRTVSAGDGLIAATARRHGLHLMTRNVDDFAATGVLLLNPWTDTD